MPKRTKNRGERLPSYRLHKPTGQAVVTLSGRDHYLGVHQTPGSVKRYHELVAKWLANDKQPLKPTKPVGDDDEDDDAITVAELALRYIAWANGAYIKDGKPTREPSKIRYALKPVVEKFGAMRANDFGPNCLRAIREAYIATGMLRATVNTFADRVKRMFKYAVSHELVRAEVVVALNAVGGLRKGRTSAPEGEPTKPVPDDVFAKVLAELKQPFRALYAVQRACGARAGELFCMKAADIDTSGPVWLYSPSRHKGQHLDKARVIALGPRCQEHLKPMLERARDGGLVFRNRNGNAITTTAYGLKVQQTSERIGVPYYRPHCLRHAYATQVRRLFDLESAQVVLGYAKADVTQIYAERDATKAAAVAAQIG